MTKPCRKCGKPTDLMAWRLVVNGVRDDDMYRVCHKCNLAVTAFGKPTQPPVRPEWTKPTQWHWQMRLHGELLDYWCGKKPKYRWRGKTYAGKPDIEALR